MRLLFIIFAGKLARKLAVKENSLTSTTVINQNHNHSKLRRVKSPIILESILQSTGRKLKNYEAVS